MGGNSVDNGEQAKRLLEEQNDEQISHLSLQISQLKQVRRRRLGSFLNHASCIVLLLVCSASAVCLYMCLFVSSPQLSTSIHSEVVDQNRYLDGMVRTRL